MKKLFITIPLVFLFCLTFSCQNKEAAAELEEMKTLAQLEAKNKTAVRRMLELGDEGNMVEATKYISSDCLFHAGGVDYSSEAYFKRASKFFTAFPDLKHDIKDVIAEGDKVVLYMIESGTHTGDFMGTAPTGEIVTWPVIAIYRLSNGIVEEVWVELDLLSLMQRLGGEIKP